MHKDEKIKADNNPFDNTSVVESVVVDSEEDSSVVVLLIVLVSVTFSVDDVTMTSLSPGD